jgi:hypothetical protein
MDWTAAQENVRKWFASASRIPFELVSFAGEPVGMKPDTWAELAFTRLDVPEGGDEVRLTPNPDDETGATLIADQCGNRLARLTCRVRSRDRSPGKHPFRYLERVRTRTELPAAQEAFEAAGIGLREVFPSVAVPVDFDNREEVEAVLEMSFAYTSSSLDEDGPETVPVLAGVRIGGTARTDGGALVTVPEQQIPEPEETP